MNRCDEFDAKRERVRELLSANGWDALLLRTRANIAWLGSGPSDGVPLEAVQGSRSEIWYQAETGVLALLVTADETILLTENIELPRLMRDEFDDLPLEVVGQPWWESDLVAAMRQTLGEGAAIAADLVEGPMAEDAFGAGLSLVDRRDEIAALRASLLPRERERYAWLGRTAATTMGAVCRGITRGTPEAAVVADAHARLRPLGIAQEVDIVCADDRLLVDRHGLYSDRRIERAAMVVFGAHKWGLVVSLTRMVHLGPAPSAVHERHRALAAFDRRLIEATRPGVALRDLFTGTIQPGYAALGEPDAWQDHHQGGSTGYTGRDQRVTPTTKGTVQPDQAYAWNPSLPGVKSEDTVVVGNAGPEVLTVDPDWPVYPDSGRPAIVELG
jgi:Xaa-Pro aminopeptidase